MNPGKPALIVVDVQNDFCPGGALAVPQGDEIVPVVNRLAERFPIVVATQDWHPADHVSFAANHPGKQPGDVIVWEDGPQILWPVHCVQDSAGAAFHPQLNAGRFARVFRKGTDPRIDSYSGFFDNRRRHATGLHEFLRQSGVNQVYVCGLATDYCVKWTVLDALALGYRTAVIRDACRGVGLQPGDVEKAFREMAAAGAELVDSHAVLVLLCRP
ncbi:MAG: bifunctional nicotinamidase/pyrazinamidase [Thermogutta sp.]|nr:bifunctional nicotinamidase/pyrazinamidase [Thermogutta sp.]